MRRVIISLATHTSGCLLGRRKRPHSHHLVFLQLYPNTLPSPISIAKLQGTYCSCEEFLFNWIYDALAFVEFISSVCGWECVNWFPMSFTVKCGWTPIDCCYYPSCGLAHTCNPGRALNDLCMQRHNHTSVHTTSSSFAFNKEVEEVHEIFICGWGLRIDRQVHGNDFRPGEPNPLTEIVRCCIMSGVGKGKAATETSNPPPPPPQRRICSSQSQLPFISISRRARKEQERISLHCNCHSHQSSYPSEGKASWTIGDEKESLVSNWTTTILVISHYESFGNPDGCISPSYTLKIQFLILKEMKGICSYLIFPILFTAFLLFVHFDWHLILPVFTPPPIDPLYLHYWQERRVTLSFCQ